MKGASFGRYRFYVVLEIFLNPIKLGNHILNYFSWNSLAVTIGQLVSLFSNGQIVQSLDAHSRLNILVQLLTFVPEEYATSFLTKRHRNSVFKYCREKAIPCTLSLLTSLLKVDSTSVEQRCSSLK